MKVKTSKYRIDAVFREHINAGAGQIYIINNYIIRKRFMLFWWKHLHVVDKDILWKFKITNMVFKTHKRAVKFMVKNEFIQW